MSYPVIDELLAAREGSAELDEIIQQTLPASVPVRKWTRDYEAACFLASGVTGKFLIIMDDGRVEFASEDDFGEHGRICVIAPPDTSAPEVSYGPDMALEVARSAYVHLLAMEEVQRLDNAEHNSIS